MKDSSNWYTQCREAIQAEFGPDTDLFIDILSATSPRKQVTANYRLAFYIYHVSKTQGFLLPYDLEKIPGLMKSMYPNVIRALMGEPLSGNKVSAFAAALKGDLDAVVIDVWMCRWYDFQGNLTNLAYNALAERVRREARQCGMRPAEYQAMIWTMCRRKYGKKDVSYLSVPDRGQTYFEFYFGD